MSNYSRLSPTAVIFGAYPDAFRNITDSIVQVRNIAHPEGELRSRRAQYVLEKIARRMTFEKTRVEDHFREAQRRIASKKQRAQDGGDDDLGLGDVFGGIEALDETLTEAAEQTRPVRPGDLSFILVDDDSSIRTRVFPRSFHCQACGHYVAINPAQPPASLTCSHCREGHLVQEPIIFMCARCASIRELAPPGARINDKLRRRQSLEDFLGRAPGCPDCSDGHIHLEKHGTNSIENWEWRCTSCGYKEVVQYPCMQCYLPGVQDQDNPANNINSEIVFMNAFPAAAPSALRGLSDVQMFIHDEPLDPASLLETARQRSENWADYFELQHGVGSALMPEDEELIRRASIDNVYLLDRVGVVTTVYGYRAGNIASHPMTPVDEPERLARFFKDPGAYTEYVCYGMINEGAALVIELDRQSVIERLSEIDPTLSRMSYEDLFERECQILSGTPMKNILQASSGSNQLLLFRSLHGYEHAILSSAIQSIGNEVLGSILFPREGILLVYEREPIGRGGVVQVVNKGPGLIGMLEAASDHVIGCAQGCIDGCPACMYVRDAHCNYNYEELGRSWLPANSLLSRIGARKLLASDIPL